MNFMLMEDGVMSDDDMIAKMSEWVMEDTQRSIDKGRAPTLSDLWKWACLSTNVGTPPTNASDACKDIIEVTSIRHKVPMDVNAMRQSSITVKDAFKFMEHAKKKGSQSPAASVATVSAKKAGRPPARPPVASQSAQIQIDDPSDDDDAFETHRDNITKTVKEGEFNLTAAEIRELIKKTFEQRKGKKIQAKPAGIKKPRGRPKGSGSSSPKSKSSRKNNMTKSKLLRNVKGSDMNEICQLHGIPSSGSNDEKAAAISKYWKENPDEITKDLSKELIKGLCEKISGGEIPAKTGKEALIDMLQDECGF